MMNRAAFLCALALLALVTATLPRAAVAASIGRDCTPAASSAVSFLMLESWRNRL
jgi:hypothetical protein